MDCKSSAGLPLLTEWPSFRVFLLDAMLGIDPVGAIAMARQTLQSPTTSDEWAVAMRNLALGAESTEDASLLRTRSAEMLDNSTCAPTHQARSLSLYRIPAAIIEQLIVAGVQASQRASVPAFRDSYSHQNQRPESLD